MRPTRARRAARAWGRPPPSRGSGRLRRRRPREPSGGRSAGCTNRRSPWRGRGRRRACGRVPGVEVGGSSKTILRAKALVVWILPPRLTWSRILPPRLTWSWSVSSGRRTGRTALTADAAARRRPSVAAVSSSESGRKPTAVQPCRWKHAAARLMPATTKRAPSPAPQGTGGQRWEEGGWPPTGAALASLAML